MSEEKKMTDEEFVKALENTKETLEDLSDEDDDHDNLLLVKKIVNYSLDLIHRLQSENAEWHKDYIALDLEARKLQTELDKELAEHEEFTKNAKAEIERLTLAVEGLKGENKVIHKENDELLGKIERLEKDVHDMSWIIKIHKYCVGADHCQNSSTKEFELQKQVDELKDPLYEEHLVNLGYAKAVKDTAKEILQQMYDETEPCTKSHEWVRKRIKEIAKSKGVEVE